MKYEFWFVVGSQDLYGEEVLKTVAQRAGEMAKEMSRKAKEFADTNFSSDAFASRVLEIYQDAIKNNYQKKRGLIKTLCHSLWDRFPLV